MRLKYYLRGLGLGIIFAVIIMMIGFHGNKQSMSDTEIIEKSKTLGMVEAKNISGTVADEYNSEKTLKKVKYLCTNRKYLTFFWKIFHYICAGLTVLYRKRKRCV